MTSEDSATYEDQPDAPSPIDDQAQTIERLTAEVSDLKDKYMRAAAEMENVRRRVERERSDLIKFALESAFKDFLPVLDGFDRALPEASAAPVNGAHADASFREGMLLVKRQLLDTLRKHGLEPIEAAGAPFDPNVHQGIQRVESADVDAETVGNEFARGYTLNGRLLRPAMVSVLVPSS